MGHADDLDNLGHSVSTVGQVGLIHKLIIWMTDVIWISHVL